MTVCAEIRERYFAAAPLPIAELELSHHLAACLDCASAARALAVADAALAGVPSAPPSFAALAPAASAAARSRRRRIAARRVLPFAATAAAAALVVAGVWRVGGEPPLAAPGTVLEAPEHARLATGARVALESGRLEVAAAAPGEERLRMGTGSVVVQVPHLPVGASLVVETPAALVRVHGTRFRVLSESGRTSVWVSEGVVEVTPVGAGRAPLLLHAGESCEVEGLAEYRQTLEREAVAALERGESGQAEAALAQLLASEPEPVQAAEAYALYARAASATGDRAAAIEKYRRALRVLPAQERPIWADNAAAELALLLEESEPTSAAEAWHEYVVRFPDGLHAARARVRIGR